MEANEIEIARKASEYWTKYLTDPSTSKFDNGDTSKNGAILAMLAEIGKVKSHPEEEIEAFRNDLFDSIIRDKPSFIGVDYSPSQCIDKAASKNITKYSNMSTFPCKTRMSINWETGEIYVSEGYGAESKKI